MSSTYSRKSASKQKIFIALIAASIFVLVGGIGFTMAFIQAPQRAFEALRLASSIGDVAAMEELVDYVSLRMSVKQYLVDTGKASVEANIDTSGFLAQYFLRIGKIVAEAALDLVLEAVVSPNSLNALIDGYMPLSSTAQGSPGSPAETLVATSLESVDLFVVSIYRPSESRWVMQLFFVRTGLLEWKLSGVRPL